MSEPDDRRARASLIFGRLRAGGDGRRLQPEPAEAGEVAEEGEVAEQGEVAEAGEVAEQGEVAEAGEPSQPSLPVGTDAGAAGGAGSSATAGLTPGPGRDATSDFTAADGDQEPTSYLGADPSRAGEGATLSTNPADPTQAGTAAPLIAPRTAAPEAAASLSPTDVGGPAATPEPLAPPAPAPPEWVVASTASGSGDRPVRVWSEPTTAPGDGRGAHVTGEPAAGSPTLARTEAGPSAHLLAPDIPSPTSVPPASTPVAGMAPVGSENGDSPGDRSGDYHPDPPPLADLDRPRRHPAAVDHPLPRRFAIANQKGGVGKTTTAVNLGAALAELEYRVLVVDLDPQGNATTGLGINARNLDASIYDVILHDVPIEDVIEPTTLRNLFVVPATIDLAGAEIELVPVFSRELRLRRALQVIEADFDFVLIDCPPSLGLLTVNGLAAAGEVVVPIQCEYYALEGLGQLLRNVGLVQSNLNTGLEVSTIILTMYDARTRLAEQVVEEVRRHFGDRVCRNVVPRTVRLSEAPSFGQPIIVFDPSSRGAIAYRELAKEVSGGAPQRVR